MKKSLHYKIFREYFLITVGSLITAIGIDFFLVPANIAAGGASGLSILLSGLFAVPVSVSILAINSGLFVAGYRMLKKEEMIKTVFATVLLSLFVEIFSKVSPVTGDTMLSAVYGAVFVGSGIGLVIICGASTGGSDLAAVILKKFFPYISVTKLILIIDFAIVLISGVVFSDYTLLLYAVLSLFLTAKVADLLIDGVNFSKLVFIIADDNEKIVEYIINNLKRGVTSFKAKGEFSGDEKTVLMSAISPRQFPGLKSFVKNTDANAFIILSDVRSVFGEGFNIE